MAFTKEEADNIKKHLLKQLSNFPEDKRKEIKEQIESMNSEQIETFVNQNNLNHLGSSCIFCSIVGGKTNSFQIAEDEKNIAILELTPLSKGHTLVVPKDHSKEIFTSSKIFAEKLSKILEKKFKPKEIQINEIEIMEHKLLEVIPIYGDEKERKQISEIELKNLQEKILKNEEIEEEEIEEEPKIEIQKISPRIP
jgi:histidine triad (HIT) family protein